MYSGEDNYYWRDEAELRRRFRRRLRIKRALVFVAFLLVLSLVGLLIFFMGRGALNLIRNRNGSISSDYVKEPEGIKLEVVDNKFSDEELMNYFGISSSGTDLNSEDSGGSASSEKGEGTAGKDSESDPAKDDKPASGIKNRSGLIVIDAGHGGMDSGTFNGDILEKNINLEIALKVNEELISRGYTVFMTRSDDTYVGLQKRADLANAQENVLAMVSIHQNAVDSQKDQCYGVEAWTYDREGCGEFAQYLVDEICEATGAKNRGYAFKKNLVVTSKTTMPSVLIECGFISNDEECTKLASDDYQQLIACAIADATDRFIDSYY